MFSAEMPDLPPYVTRSSGLWKQTDGSDSKNSGDTGWESINWNIWKGKRGTARFQLPPPLRLPAIILVSEDPLGELDVICMCVFEEGCS